MGCYVPIYLFLYNKKIGDSQPRKECGGKMPNLWNKTVPLFSGFAIAAMAWQRFGPEALLFASPRQESYRFVKLSFNGTFCLVFCYFIRYKQFQRAFSDQGDCYVAKNRTGTYRRTNLAFPECRHQARFSCTSTNASLSLTVINPRPSRRQRETLLFNAFAKAFPGLRGTAI